jgi:hypothetical protein
VSPELTHETHLAVGGASRDALGPSSSSQQQPYPLTHRPTSALGPTRHGVENYRVALLPSPVTSKETEGEKNGIVLFRVRLLLSNLDDQINYEREPTLVPTHTNNAEDDDTLLIPTTTSSRFPGERREEGGREPARILETLPRSRRAPHEPAPHRITSASPRVHQGCPSRREEATTPSVGSEERPTKRR